MLIKENLRKRLVKISLVVFILAYIVILFSGMFKAFLFATLVLAAVICISKWLCNNAYDDNLHSWPYIAIILLAFMALSFSTAFTSTRRIAKNQKQDEQIICQTETENDDEESEEEVAEQEEITEETEPEEVYEEKPEVQTQTVEKVVTKVVEKKVEVPVEKKVEVPVEVPVEVEKKVTEYVEVPVVEYVEVPATTPTTTQTPSYNYTGDPTGGTYGYNYTGDPTSSGYGYTGDPTGSYYGSSTSVKISGPKTVTQGKSYTYTITGVSSVSESRLELPANVTAEKVGSNKFKLYFEEGYTGSYHIGYGSASISIKVGA